MNTHNLNRIKLLSVGSVFLFLIMFTGCNEAEGPTEFQGSSSSQEIPNVMFSNDNSAGVVHHVSVGGADICDALGQPTGCDQNYSLSANVKADGTITGGIWRDTWPGGQNGPHVALDCVNIVGNGAVVGGIIINKGPLEGFRALTAVEDNGTSSSQPYDRISFLNPPGLHDFLPCTELSPDDFALFDLVNGQVQVR